MSEWFWKTLSYLAGLLVIGFLFGLLIFQANIEIKDLDLWLHISTGKFIVENHIIPKTDIFSATIYGQPWVNHEWLFQVVIYLASQLAGLEGLINLQVLVVFVTFSLLFFMGYSKERQLSVSFILLLVLLIYQLRFTLRPDLFSLLYFTLFIYMLAMHIDHRRSIWVILIVQILWTNTHGFFILGPFIVFLGIVAEWFKRRIKLPYEWNTTARLTDVEYRRLQFIFVGVAMASLVNPYGIHGALYPLNVLFSMSGESKIFFSHIGELQKPISWNNIWDMGRYPYYKLLILISCSSLLFNKRKIDLGALFLWLFFLLFSFKAVRNVPYFAFAAYFVILTNIPHIALDRISSFKIHNERIKIITVLFLKILMVFWIMNYIEKNVYRGYFDFDKMERKSEYGGISLRNYPVKAVDFIVDNKISGRFFNDFNSGAYLIGRASDHVKVFIDGRTEVYGPKFFNEYRKAWKGDTKLFDRLVDQYRLTGAFLNYVYAPAPEGTIKHLYDQKEWVLVYFDYDAVVFLKNIPENKDWIKKFTVDLSTYKTKEMDLLELGARNVTPYQFINRANALFNMGLIDEAEKEALEAKRITPHYIEPYKILGKISLKREEYFTAFDYFRKAKLLNPYDVKVRYHLALSYYHLGELQQAIDHNNRVLAKNSNNPKGLFLLSSIYAKQKKYDQSMDLFFKAKKLAPNMTDEMIKIGDLFFEEKQFENAKAVYLIVQEKSPENKMIERKISEINEKL